MNERTRPRTGARTRGLGAALALPVLLLSLYVRAPIAEDWDGLGFVASVSSFDLATFSPHPPGYPVYVAVLRLVALVVLDPALAGAVVSALSAAVCAYCTFRMLASRVSILTAICGAATGAASSLALRSASQVGTESLGLALLVGGLSLAMREPEGAAEAGPDRVATVRAALLSGLFCGLGLGVRLSWWPLYLAVLALVVRRARLRALLCAGAGVAAWAIPLAWVVGPRRLVALFAAHGEGHAQRFGRTLLHDGDVRGHLAAVARDLIADGLGVDTSALGLAIAVIAAIGFARFVSLWANGAQKPGTVIPLALLAYGLFVVLFQNVIESPRHLLPIVYAACVAAGVGMATPWAPGAGKIATATAVGGALLVLLAGARAVSDARARTTEPPLGAQVVALARSEPGFERGDVAIFGGDSARFAIAAGVPGGYAENLGDVSLSLGAMPHLPATTFVTGEVSLGTRFLALPPEATVCRPARLDRKHRCLTVYRLAPR